MIARIRSALTRSRRIGYSRGFRDGIEDAAHCLPPELVNAYWAVREAQEGNLIDLRKAEGNLHDLLGQMIEGEKA